MKRNVLFGVGVALLAVWLIGLLFKVLAWVIHLALVAAVIFFIAGFVRRKLGPRRPSGGP